MEACEKTRFYDCNPPLPYGEESVKKKLIDEFLQYPTEKRLVEFFDAKINNHEFSIDDMCYLIEHLPQNYDLVKVLASAARSNTENISWSRDFFDLMGKCFSSEQNMAIIKNIGNKIFIKSPGEHADRKFDEPWLLSLCNYVLRNGGMHDGVVLQIAGLICENLSSKAASAVLQIVLDAEDFISDAMVQKTFKSIFLNKNGDQKNQYFASLNNEELHKLFEFVERKKLDYGVYVRLMLGVASVDHADEEFKELAFQVGGGMRTKIEEDERARIRDARMAMRADWLASGAGWSPDLWKFY